MARIHIKGCGGIYEIRFLKDDLGMSNNHPSGNRTDNIESIRAA
jgi:hypothetical protein